MERQINLEKREPELTVIQGRRNRCFVSDEAYHKNAEALMLYSNNSIDENIWHCSYQNDTKTVAISFSNLKLPEQELRLVKTYLIDSLANGIAPTTCAEYARELKYLFDFLEKRGITVDRISTSVAYMYREWIDTNFRDFSASKKNCIETAAARFAGFLQAMKLLPPTPVAFPSPRKIQSRAARAPEERVMNQLDRYMFDFSKPVPTDIRLQYIIHRILPSRFAEVRLMRLDGYHIEGDLQIIEVPTQKESAYHRPTYRQFPFFTSGTVFETSLLRALEEQQSFAIAAQSGVEDKYKGYLMVSTAHPHRLLNNDEFNKAIRNVCEDLELTDSEGNPCRITSHALRHVSIRSLLSSGIPLKEVQKRSGHRNPGTTMGYGYPAKSDEIERLREMPIPYAKSKTDDDKEPHSACRTVLPKLFAKMKREDVWFLGDDCLCAQLDCVPQWEHCIMECEKFQPDIGYLTMAQEICSRLEQYGEGISAHQKRQLDIWRKFIERIGVKQNG